MSPNVRRLYRSILRYRFEFRRVCNRVMVLPDSRVDQSYRVDVSNWYGSEFSTFLEEYVI
jgi:hypothetical protein